MLLHKWFCQNLTSPFIRGVLNFFLLRFSRHKHKGNETILTAKCQNCGALNFTNNGIFKIANCSKIYEGYNDEFQCFPRMHILKFFFFSFCGRGARVRYRCAPHPRRPALRAVTKCGVFAFVLFFLCPPCDPLFILLLWALSVYIFVFGFWFVWLLCYLFMVQSMVSSSCWFWYMFLMCLMCFIEFVVFVVDVVGVSISI